MDSDSTCVSVSQLSAHNTSIIAIPGVITHRPPLPSDADLHPASIAHISHCSFFPQLPNVVLKDHYVWLVDL